jgi:hypothetical protein
MVRDSILNEFEKALTKKKKAFDNNERLKIQIQDQIDTLKQEIKAGI